MKDSLGQVIYIGKAKNLPKRVSHYFENNAKFKAYNAKIASLVDIIDDFDHYTTKSEAEALILESKLIKKWHPRYNTLEKDNKNFLLLRVEKFSPLPKFTFCRNRKEDNSLYFGPYLGAAAIRSALRQIHKDFGILLAESHPKKLPDGTWQLYDDARSEISKFANIVSEAEYNQRVVAALDYLKGRDDSALSEAEEKMKQASASLDFEKAAKYRDLIAAILETRKVNARAKVDTNLSRTPQHIAELAMESLRKSLKLKKLPRVIECFDISHISGSFCVASMVHFENGEPVNRKYRHFKIKSFVGNNDFRSMHEVVGRRYKRLEQEGVPMPDIILIDGGREQVYFAMKAFDDNGLAIPFIIGLAKREETVVLDDGTELKLSRTNEGLKLLQRARDEAHRFANSFNADLRSKRIRESILDDCPSIGQKRKEAILKYFGSISRVKAATVKELCQVEGIGFETAVEIRDFLDANFLSREKYRGRIAPTPSGLLHIGHANTFKIAATRAAERGGDLVLRIEDIDRQRCKQEYVDAVIEGLKSINIYCTEGYNIGGDFAPYRQSLRFPFYWQVLRELISKKLVYPSEASRKDIKDVSVMPKRTFDFCESEPIFPAKFRNENFSLEAISNPKLVNWRFKVPDSQVVGFIDNNSGVHEFVAGEDFGDFLVWRKSGEPSYELAVVADDHAMKITEVVRGEDLLLSTARQILVYKALGWSIPEFFHCRIVKDDFGNKLSKSSLEGGASNKWLIRNSLRA